MIITWTAQTDVLSVWAVWAGRHVAESWSHQQHHWMHMCKCALCISPDGIYCITFIVTMCAYITYVCTYVCLSCFCSLLCEIDRGVDLIYILYMPTSGHMLNCILRYMHTQEVYECTDDVSQCAASVQTNHFLHWSAKQTTPYGMWSTLLLLLSLPF